VSRIIRVLAPATILFLAACGGSPDADAAAAPAESAAMAEPMRSVMVSSPADGSTVDGPAVTVDLMAHGFTVVPAGDSTPNSGHLHLFLDRDLSPAGQPIPKEPGFIVHMGDGASTYTFENVTPGEHRLIAVVGDALHVPVQPWLVDTVHFTVR